eukprot:scaffold108955_cov63-Phaeocystis_antarctica.AAC.2
MHGMMHVTVRGVVRGVVRGMVHGMVHHTAQCRGLRDGRHPPRSALVVWRSELEDALATLDGEAPVVGGGLSGERRGDDGVGEGDLASERREAAVLRRQEVEPPRLAQVIAQVIARGIARGIAQCTAPA